jgi:septal ring factor EnvC (AmiA/AmiB activator)
VNYVAVVGQGYEHKHFPETAQQEIMRKMMAATTARQATILERDATLLTLQDQVCSVDEQRASRDAQLVSGVASIDGLEKRIQAMAAQLRMTEARHRAERGEAHCRG